jgi:hypothetical protein
MKYLNLTLIYIFLSAGAFSQSGQFQGRAPTAVEQYEKPYKAAEVVAQQFQTVNSIGKTYDMPKFYNVKIVVTKNDFTNAHFTDSIFKTAGQYVFKAKAKKCDLIYLRIKTCKFLGKVKSQFFDVNILLQESAAGEKN